MKLFFLPSDVLFIAHLEGWYDDQLSEEEE